MPKRLPACGKTFDDMECTERGDHTCKPRSAHIQAFFSEILVHTKGRWSRTPFHLLDWQVNDIMEPLFAEVTWSTESERYVRRYRLAWIEVARKNGKALDVDTPILTDRGPVPMWDIQVGDKVHSPDGSQVPVIAVGPVHRRQSYRVQLADGRSVVASDEHEWLVIDRLRSNKARIVTTAELMATHRCGARGDTRYRVPVPNELDRQTPAALPLDPYLLGLWLGDGTTLRGEITTMDPEIVAAIGDAGFRTSYVYQRGRAATYGIPGLGTVLRRVGVLGNKHVPDLYKYADAKTRAAVLAGLMDTDGGVGDAGSVPQADFCGTRRLVDDMIFLARSLGYKPGPARPHNGSWRTTFNPCVTDGVFRLPRKNSRLSAEARQGRSTTIAVSSVEPVGERDVRCIQVQGGMFLAGLDLVPTHNSELLAGIALYLCVADDEDGAEIYGCAVDRDQARKVYDVAERMVQLSPLLSSRLKINKQAKRIYDTSTGSYYEALASDASGNLGHNPHGIVFDEVLTQKNADLWNAMRTGMGARDQPLMVAATTAGADPQSFGKTEHDEMQKIADDPERARHIFVYLRNLPMDADPWDETLWPLANPALGQFLSLQSLRDEAQEAKNDPGKENAFRQFRLNQWVSQSSRWMPMHLWDKCTGDLWLNPQWHNRELRGRTAYAGFDLAAKFDLTAWALVIPGDEPKEDPAHIMWRFWLPESGLERLDQFHDGKFTRWARQGWLTVTSGSVIDYDKVIDDIAEDAKEYRIVAADCDEWSMWPIINRIGDALNLSIDEGELTAYRNTYDRMSPGMTDLMGTVKRGLLRHHGNPVARFCFDQCEVRMAPYDPNLIRPEKPERARDKARIDAVPAAAMAVNAWKSREGVDQYRSAYEDGNLMVI